MARPVQHQLRRAALRLDGRPYSRRTRRFRKATSAGTGIRAITGRIVQIVIALVVTPEGLPLAYKALPGNTSDKTTLRPFLERIERQYGKARRVWLMDRGVPTEELLAEMRAADPPVHYLVGTPKGRLTRLEKPGRPAVARGATRSAGGTVGAGGRALRLGPKPRPRR